jgi:nucleoside-diphosphate-sugar epimerase
MRILVTGCAGFVGSHVTESLLDRGDEVIGLDCLTNPSRHSEKLDNLRRAADWEDFEFVLRDLAEGGLEQLAGRVDAIVHLAGEPGVRGSWGAAYADYLRNNVLATQRLLDAAPATTRIVMASSSSIYGDLGEPVSPYGATKLAAEQLAAVYRRTRGHDVSVLRYFTVYGPRQRPDMAFARFCRAAADGDGVVVHGDGRQVRDFTYVGDAVDATLRALGAPAGTYDVGGGSPASVLEAIEVIEEVTGRELMVLHGPPVPGDVRATASDPARAVPARRGHTPSCITTPLAEGLARQAAEALALSR